MPPNSRGKISIPLYLDSPDEPPAYVECVFYKKFIDPYWEWVIEFPDVGDSLVESTICTNRTLWVAVANMQSELFRMSRYESPMS